jgi:hypothetical protein
MTEVAHEEVPEPAPVPGGSRTRRAGRIRGRTGRGAGRRHGRERHVDRRWATNIAPAITAFNLTLNGSTRTVTTKVGAWSVTDATGSNAGYSVTVADTAPTVTGAVGASAGTGSALTLTPTTATAASGNPAGTGPVAEAAQLLSTTAATIDNAAATTGQGEWDFAADTGAAANLSIVIPADASAGAYSSTLTFTTAAPVA